MADIVTDLVGPNVKFHHSKLNFKWANGGEEVKWHYDISFYPHTNYSPLTVGTYSDLGRPLLLNAMSSADAFPYTVNPIKPKHDQYMLRGKRARDLRTMIRGPA